MSSNLKVNNILPSTGDTVAVSGIASVTSSVSIASSCTASTFFGSGANLTSLPAQATIANNADNRVITGGSGVNLNGEANLTFNGNALVVNNTSSNTAAHFKGAAGAGFIQITDSDDSSTAFIGVDGGALKFQTSGSSYSDKLRIDSNGKFCFGTYTNGYQNNDSVANFVNAASSGTENPLITLWNPTTVVDARASIDFLTNNNSGTGRDGAFIRASNDGVTAKAHLQFGTIKDESYVKTMELASGGDLSISDGNLVIGTSGHGISFAATSDAGGMANELLDDYEEGSFTPNFIQGYSSITYNANNGFYTKIGNHVSYSIYISVLSASGQNAEIRIGLPFTTKNTMRLEEGAYIVYDANTLSTSNDEKSNCYIMSGRNYTYLRLFKNNNSAAIYGNDTTLGTGGNNTYLLIKGFLTTA